MTIETLFGFVVATSALAISPGPDNIYVLMQSITNGRNYGLATVAGLISGCLVHTTLVAFGVSAISDIKGVYIQNHTDLSKYRDSIEKGQLAISKGYISDLDDRIRHTVIMTLIAQFELNTVVIEKMFNIRFFDYFGEEVDKLKPMVDDEMVEVHRGGVQATIKVTERGRLLIRCICMVFDKYLNSSIKYSKVI